MKKVIVIGSGFAGLSSAAYLSKEGFDVTIVEKNKQIGGRARNFKAKGYTFDMGPSWYWMHEIFDNFFNSLRGESNSVEVFEEWAVQVGKYGAYQNVEQIEIPLDEAKFRESPQAIENSSVDFSK